MSTEEVKALVEALRVCASAGACKTCERDLYCEPTKMLSDAAAAIEDLQAEVKRQQEKMIELAKKLPKRGEWIRVREVDIPGEMHPVAYRCMCQTCRNEYVFPRIPQFCPDCGSRNTKKIEVQDEA